jgi:hypothetical protein
MKNNCLNYQAIYADLIAFKKDEKLKVEDTILNTFKFNSSLDVLEFNSLLFPNENVDTAIANQKLKSYTLEDISRILSYKKAQNLSLKEVPYKFKISKVTLWKDSLFWLILLFMVMVFQLLVIHISDEIPFTRAHFFKTLILKN